MDSSDGVSANPQRGPFIGRPMPRFEDLRLVRGGGRYTDDISVPGQASAVFVRTPHAHASIVAIDTSAARAHPGVLAVLTGDDYVADGISAWRTFPIRPMPSTSRFRPSRPCRSGRFSTSCNCRSRPAACAILGEAVAIVVAESLVAARDAAETGRGRIRDPAGGHRCRGSAGARRADDLAERTRQSCARQRVRRSAPRSKPPSRAPTS